MADALPDPAGTRAVLIAAPRYTHLSDLPATAENVRELERLLTAPALLGLAPEHVVRLDDEAVTRNTVLAAINTAAREATEALIVYFAGHGLLEQPSLDLHLAMRPASPDRLYEAIRYDDLRREVLVANRRARLKLVVLDCCYSGRAVGGMGDDDAGKMVAEQTAINGTCVITSCAGTKLALSPEGERFTAFTGELIDVLRRGVPDKPALLTADMIFESVTSSLRSKRRPLPQIRGMDLGGSIPLVRNAAPPPSPTGSAAARPEPRRAALAMLDAARTLDDVVIAAVRETTHLLDGHASLMCQRNEAGLWRVASEYWPRDGIARRPLDKTYQMQNPPSARPASDATVLVTSDAGRDGDPARAGLLRRRDLMHALITPIVADGKLWGELICARGPEGPAFSDDAVATAVWITERVASGIANATLRLERDEALRAQKKVELDYERLALRSDLYRKPWRPDRPAADHQS